MARTSIMVSIETWQRMCEFKKENGTVLNFLADAAINKFLDAMELQEPTTSSEQNSDQKPIS